MMLCCKRLVALACTLILAAGVSAEEYDVVIYGGTSGGIAAAIQAARMDCRVVLIEPSQHLGGLTSGGLGATDIGNKAAIGGISREFYQRIKAHYSAPDVWRWEGPEDYVNRRQDPAEDAMWFFEPHVAEAIFREWLAEYPIAIVQGERLNRSTGVQREAGRITRIEMESGRAFSGSVFIDATYEGDLMAAAQVSYLVGRESNAIYQETLNGVQTVHATKHQFLAGVDPYVRPGEPRSGLVPGLDPTGPGEDGAGDHRVQAYCFRMCVTDVPENQIPFEKPADYDAWQYELLFRNFEAGETRAPWHPLMMPNRKTDANNNHGFSTDFIGMSYEWAEADHETREEIFAKHLSYQRGLMWTLANHPRVPEAIRREVGRWGNCRDEFAEHEGWSHQLYIREARRLIGEEVMTQHHCQGRVVADQPVGLAAYTMDSHHVQRNVDPHGHVRNEGDVQVGGFPPYPIGYRSLLPKRKECENLLVPVCLSASHIAYGSIRMEPVFMVLGQSAATAACLAIQTGCELHDLPYEQLEARLQQDGQVLSWNAPQLQALDPKQLAGVVLDDHEAQLTGHWIPSRSVARFVGQHYLHDNNELKGQATAAFVFEELPVGSYEVRMAYTPHANRATNVPLKISVDGESDAYTVNQRQNPPVRGSFLALGVYAVEAGQTLKVMISNADTDGFVVVDAIWLVPRPSP